MTSRSVPDKVRNEFFATYCKEKSNRACVDCGSPNPQWATSYFGILFCLECSGQHRSLGTHLTFVRSITMDTWKEHEIASMQAGGNAAMLAWWKEHDVNPRASIRDKYSHPSTQVYRQKIKCAIEGKEFVESNYASGSTSSSSLSKSTGGTSSSSSSSSNGKKKSHKSSGKSSSSSKSRSSSTPATGAVGTMFSFEDNPSSLKSSSGGGGGGGGGADDDSDSDAEFESFVAEQPKVVHAVPNYGERKGIDYSDPRLKQYENKQGFSSDDFHAPAPRDGPVKEEAPSELFSVFANGWTTLTQAATQAKEKVVQSTGELTGKVAQAKIGEKATSFIQFLWTGEEMEPSADADANAAAPPTANANAGFQANNVAAATPKTSQQQQQRVVSPTFGDDDGWGAWDGNDASEPSAANKEDAWGAWGSSPSAPAKKPAAASATAAPTAAKPVKEKKKKSSSASLKSSSSGKSVEKQQQPLVDLSFSGSGSAEPSKPKAPAPDTNNGGPPPQTLSLLDLLSVSFSGGGGAASTTTTSSAATPVNNAQKDGWDDKANDDWAAFLASKNK